jgi:hypothetical protein
MNKLITSGTFIALLLTGCTTPVTILENPKTGQIVSCGGNMSSSMVGGAIGYHMQKSNDEKCVQRMKTEGFVVK